jgi:hypothetical protein
MSAVEIILFVLFLDDLSNGGIPTKVGPLLQDLLYALLQVLRGLDVILVDVFIDLLEALLQAAASLHADVSGRRVDAARRCPRAQPT